MGGGSGSGQSSSTYSPPPQVTAAYEALLKRSQPLFSQPFQPYGGDQAAGASSITPYTVAPQTPNQVAAGQNIASLAGYYQPYGNAATDLVQQGSKPIGLQQFNNQAVNQYMSPFMQNVMGTTTANINETNAQQQQQVLGNSISKGAFGGDRSGIAQAELARQQNLANNATLANIANTGYNSALGQFNTSNSQNMQAQGLSRQLAQSGAGLLSNIGSAGQNAAIQQAQAQYGVGAQQQQQNQAELSTAYQNYLNQIGYPFQRANFESGLVGSMASGMGGTTTNNPAQPSGMSQAIGGLGAIASFLPLLAKDGGRIYSPEDRNYAKGGDVVPEGLGVSPIAGMAASSYIPTGSAPMANPHVPQVPGGNQDPNKDMYSNLKDAVKNVKSMMDKKSENADVPETPPEGAVAPIEAEANFLDYASGGYVPHFDTGGGVAPAATNSFDALKASQQRYTQTLPNAGVMPAHQGSVGNADAIGASAPTDMATARANYNNLAGSGHASLADLQSSYDLYRNALPTGAGWSAAPSFAPPAPKEELPSGDSGGGSGPEGGGGGSGGDSGSDGVGGGGGGEAAGGEAAGGRIYAHDYAAGGTIVNYAGMPTSKTVKDQAEEAFGSGQAGGNTTVAALAAEDLLPGRAYGGVIHREHHANPDDTNDYSNVVGKAAGVAAVAPEEGVATGVPRSNIFEGLNPSSRAAKNNNPGNIIDSGFARSQPGYAGTDGRFARFETPEHGESAMHGLLENYQKRGINTPAGIIGRWAPPSDGNDTNSYAAQVAKKLGISPNDPIDVTDPKIRGVLGKAIATVEAGVAGPGAASAGPNRITPNFGEEQKTQPKMPTEVSARQRAQEAGGVNQAAYKDAFLGRLGVSMTDNQRLAMFNAFAKMAGTPGKFGVGLAAAADTYSKTLMEGNKQQREGYTAESEAKLRGEEAASKRISQKGLTTQVRSPVDKEGNFSVQSQFVEPGSTVQFGGQGQPGAAGAAGAPSGGGATGPQAPQSPNAQAEINLLGPTHTDDTTGGQSKLDTLKKLADEAKKTSGISDETQRSAIERYGAEYTAAQSRANAATNARPDLRSAITAVSELGSGGATGFGAGSDARLNIAKYLNTGLQSFGKEGGFNENNLTNADILKKISTLNANENGNSNAARWLQNVKEAFPSGDMTESAAKKLTASLLVNNTQHLDYARVANAYGKMSYNMGADIGNAFERINPQQLYAQASNDIAKLMIDNSKVNQSNGKLWNPVSALANGDITEKEFNDFAKKNGSKISNLSRFVLGQ